MLAIFVYTGITIVGILGLKKAVQSYSKVPAYKYFHIQAYENHKRSLNRKSKATNPKYERAMGR
jgi:hypothetical protein